VPAPSLRAIVVGVVLVATYLGTRLWHLGALPMFIDEGWSLHALHARQASDLFISIADGKQPLIPWLIAPFIALIPDRLLAARMMTVVSGGIGAMAAYALCRRLYGPPTGVIAVAVYVVAPLAFFYDRIALYDGPIATCALLALAVSVWWLDRPTVGRTVVLGLVLGVALLTKVSALIVVGAAPLAALALLPDRRAHWWRVVGAYAIAGAIFGALLLHPQASVLYQGTTNRYVFSGADLMSVPWRVWLDNLRHLIVALTGYLPAPLWCVYLAGLLLPVVTRDRRDLVLAAWCILLLGSTVLLDKVYYFRYYVPGAVAGLLLTARVLGLISAYLSRTLAHARATTARSLRAGPAPPRPAPGLAVLVGLILLVATAGPSLTFQWQLWYAPHDAPIPGDVVGDREQYVLSRNAGWEVDHLIDYLRAQAAQGPILIVVSPLTGHMRAWVEARLLYLPDVQVLLRDPSRSPGAQVMHLDDDDDRRLLAVGGGTVFFATSEWAGAPGEQPYRENDGDDAEMVADYPRREMPWRHRVYRLRLPYELNRVRLAQPLVFGDAGQIALVGYDLYPPAATTAGGATQSVTLYWQARKPIDRSYTVFVHAIGQGSAAPLLGQHDGLPGEGARTTDRWPPGAVIRDRHTLAFASSPACGSYRLLVGWYERETMRRLPSTPAGPPVDDKAAELRPIDGRLCDN
jgi:hypothetical protein